MKRCQIAFDIPEEVKRDVKIHAAMRGISMNLWLRRAIYVRLKQEGAFLSKAPSEVLEE